jgi:phage recombination protein Bet
MTKTPSTDLATVQSDAPRSTDLAIRPDQSRFDDTQLAALKALGVEDAPQGDVDLLFHQSVRLGLDPFAKQIYLIGRDERKKINGSWQTVGKKWTIQTGIDGFRVVRDRTKLYDGQELAWCGPDGVWMDVWTKPQPPVAARVLIYVKGRSRPEPAVAYYTEYAQTNAQGEPQAMWKKMPAGQLAKCAEALGLRKAFPQDLSGVYVDEEMQQADVGADGVPSVTSVSNQDPNRVRTRGLATETGVNARPVREDTPNGAQRPDPSRPVTNPRAGRASATPAEFEPAGWETVISYAGSGDSLHKVWIKARNANVLGEHLSSGETVEDAILSKKARLDQDAASEPEPGAALPVEEYPVDETLPF